MASPNPPSDAAIRALQGARDEIEALRLSPGPPEEDRGRILRIANAVDRSLRRLLRDDESADLSARLSALAPDEMRTDAVLAELRRSDRLPMQVAASVHELFEIRRRLEGGAPPDRGDAERSVRAADWLAEALRSAPAPPPAAPAIELAGEEPELAETPPRWRRRRAGPIPAWPAFAVVAVALLGATVWAVAGRGPDHMDQGLALFDDGEYAEAAHHFFRYAQENESDPTPHLYLARIHRRMERPDLAADAIREAQRLAPEDPAVHRELGFLLLDTGRADVAVERFRRAIELDDDSSEGWIGLIRALREAGRAAEAEETIAQAPAEVRALLTRPGPS